MSNLDLDQLRQHWKHAHQRAESQLALDVDAIRRRLQQHTRKAFGGHRRWLLAGLCTQSLLCFSLLAFQLGHVHDLLYTALAAPLSALMLAQVVVSLRQYLCLRTLDLSAPVAQVRATLYTLRNRQLRVTRWFLLGSVLLWLPALSVLARGLIGFDLARFLHPSVLWVNVGLGLVVLIVGELLLRRYARRHAAHPDRQTWLSELAGVSWHRAEQAYGALAGLDEELQLHPAATVIARHQQRLALPATVTRAIRDLRLRLTGLALVYGLAVILTGAFNAQQGGRFDLLLPGLLLHAFWLVPMVMAIEHQTRLRRANLHADPTQLGSHVRGLAERHQRVLRIWISLAPLFLGALGIVLTRVWTGRSVLLLAPWWSLLLGLLLIATLCWWLSRAQRQTLLAGWSNRMMLDVPRRSALLQAQCKREAFTAQGESRQL